MRCNKDVDPLITKKTTRKSERDRSIWLGAWQKPLEINPGPSDRRDASRWNTERAQRFKIIWILNESDVVTMREQYSQDARQYRPEQPRFGLVGRERVPETGQRIQTDDVAPECRQRSEHRRLQRNVMRDHGLDRALDFLDRSHSFQCSQWREPASCKRNLVDGETFGANRTTPIYNTCRYVDLEPQVARGSRHRQAMGQEVPVLGHDEEKPQRVHELSSK